MDEISSYVGEWCKKIARGGMEAHELMTNIGMLQRGLVQEEIARGNFKPNAPSTIKKKGSDTPLIDTETMRESVNYVVVERGSMDD